MEAPGHIETAKEAFAQIHERVPGLEAEPIDSKDFDLGLAFPVQVGLKQRVFLNLQGDELHFSAGHFWMEWFPCTDPAKVAVFVSAVVGYLSGEYRIVEHYRGTRCVKAELQRPGPAWETVATWRRLHVPIPWGTRQEVRCNA